MRYRNSILAVFVLVFSLFLQACPFGPDDDSCGDPPSKPCSPSPSNGASNQSITTDLAWGCGNSSCDLNVTYEVYWGTYTPVPYMGSADGKSFPLPLLESGTLYYWKVVARDANGSASSSVWTFTTQSCQLPPTAPSSPSPSDGATNVSVSTNLSWQGGNPQCAGNDVDYKVYFGTDPTPDSGEYQGTVENKSWNPPGDLSSNTHYYWKIVAVDQVNGQETNGAIWDFTTENDFCQITVISPNGGESWQEGSSHTILWNPTGDCSDYVEIELHRGGEVCFSIDDHAPNTGSYYWSPVEQDEDYSDNYKILVYDRSNDEGDTSDSPFTIPACEIEITHAFLNYRIVPGQDAGYSITIHKCLGSWSESSITYNNRPTWQASSMDEGSRSTHGGGTWMQWDLDSYTVSTWFDSPSSNYGLVIWDRMLNYDPGYDTMIRYYSSETNNGSEYKPYIDLWWEDCNGSHLSVIPVTQDAYIFDEEPNSPHNYSSIYAGWLDDPYNQGYVGFVKFNVTTESLREGIITEKE